MCGFVVFNGDLFTMIPLMDEIRLTTWDVKDPVNHGIFTILSGDRRISSINCTNGKSLSLTTIWESMFGLCCSSKNGQTNPSV